MMDDLQGREPEHPAAKEQNRPDRALTFVLALALTIAITVLCCSLIWWFGADHSYDILGRDINIGGVVLIALGAISLGGRSSALFNKRKGAKAANMLKSDRRRRSFVNNAPLGTLVLMNFFGAGLLCLFIGNLILLGL